MLSEIKILTKLELRNLFGWNKFRYTKDSKGKNRYLLLTAAWAILLMMVIGYTGGLVYGLVLLGLEEIVISYLVMIASLLILAFGIFKAGNVLFAKKGYDMLCSMPIRDSSVAISRFLTMYAEDLLLTGLVMLSGTAVYGYLIQPHPAFYIVVLIGMLFVPMIPLVIASVIGTVITAIASGMKHKAMAEIVLTLVFAVVIIIASFGSGEMAENASMEMLKNMAEMIDGIISGVYPPAVWIGKAAGFQHWGFFLLFISVSVCSMMVFVAAVSKSYHRICRRLFTTSAKHNYRMESLKSNGMRTALYRREMKRYFSSGVYVTNTIIGPIMGTILAAAIYFLGIEELEQLLELQGFDVKGVIPFGLAAVFTTMTTTSVSISMEGKQFWIVKSLPVPAKMVLDSKILLNLSLMLPFYIISEVLLVIALKPNGMELVWLLLIPAILCIFAVVAGISVNLRFHSFDWEREEAVVKQSVGAMLGGFAGFLVSVLCAVISVLLSGNLTKVGISLILVICISLFYRKNNQAELENL